MSDIVALIKENPTIGLFLVACILILPKTDKILESVFTFLAFLLVLCALILKGSLDRLIEIVFFKMKMCIEDPIYENKESNKSQMHKGKKKDDRFHRIKTLFRR